MPTTADRPPGHAEHRGSLRPARPAAGDVLLVETCRRGEIGEPGAIERAIQDRRADWMRV